jgi:hypothetical protein
MSIRKAAKKHNVPSSTLGDRVSNKISLTARDGAKPKLSTADEKKLINYAYERARRGIGFSKANFFRYAGDLATKRQTPFKNGRPSDKWWRHLKKRNGDITLRSPESTAAIRHQMMTEERVMPYFNTLKQELDRSGMLNNPALIWNMDETYLTLSTEPEKIVARLFLKKCHIH